MNLKEGLQELGHEVVIASHGDSWKNIERDIDLGSNLPSYLGKIYRRIKPLVKLMSLRNYDVVQLMNPFLIFPEAPVLHRLFYKYLLSNNNKFFMLAAGDDSYFWRFGRKKLAYGPFDDFLKYDIKQSNYYMEEDSFFETNKWLSHKVDGIIPIMYEYETAYEGHSKLLNTIPIPMNTNKIKYIPNTPDQKIVIFHGLNRYGFKGTRHVEEAFEILKNKYPNDLELVIKGNMPLDEYLELMKRTNVVIDQAYSHSCGVNAIYALAMGKIVLGGAEPESLRSLGIDSSPVINIKPSAHSIVEQIEKILANRSQIEMMGYASRQFAENVHGHIKVARQYLTTWEKA